jgi:hypothetical protein
VAFVLRILTVKKDSALVLLLWLNDAVVWKVLKMRE